MRCPSCASELTEVRTKTATVDICPNCKGIWFDSGEFLDFVTSLTESEKISPQTPQLFKPRQVPAPHTVKEKPKVCPRCTLVMRVFNYAYDSNIFLDKCSKCGGIWTDGGEAQAVAKHLKMNPQIAAIAKGLIERDQTLNDLADLGQAIQNPYVGRAFLAAGIPISDDTPRQAMPVVTLSIIAVCLLLHIAQLILPGDSETLFDRFGFIPTQPFGVGLITSLFLHAGLLHLIVNMLFFWVFGDNVEDKFGRLDFVLFYLACGVAGNFAHAAFTPDVSTPLIGASGAISGIMGAYLIFYPKARIRVFVITTTFYVPAFFYLGAWFLFQFIYALALGTLGASPIAWFAHVGGFALGVVAACVKKRVEKTKQ